MNKHYKNCPPDFEPLKIINIFNLPFDVGCIIKYLHRYNYKNQPVQDLEKALFYINNYQERTLEKSFCLFVEQFIINNNKGFDFLKYKKWCEANNSLLLCFWEYDFVILKSKIEIEKSLF